jgi:hypothetical protein
MGSGYREPGFKKKKPLNKSEKNIQVHIDA